MQYQIGLRIKDLRTKQNLTQGDLAKKVGISVSYLSKIESGKKKNPGGDLIGRLARKLGVNVEWLLTGKEPSTNNGQGQRKRLREFLLKRIKNPENYRDNLDKILLRLAHFFIEEIAHAVESGNLRGDPAVREIIDEYHQRTENIMQSDPRFYDINEQAVLRVTVSTLPQYLSSIKLTDTHAVISYFDSALHFHHWPGHIPWATTEPAVVSRHEQLQSLPHESWPVLTMVPAGEPATWEDIYQPGYAENYEPVPGIRDHNGFCLIVEGDSMSDKIENGDIVAISPNREVLNGDIALVRLHGDEKTIKYIDVSPSGEAYLRPHNPRYPVKRLDPGSYRILGKVMRIIKKV